MKHVTNDRLQCVPYITHASVVKNATKTG